MVIVPVSGQLIDCRPNAIVCRCKEVQGTFMLNFLIGRIVSCGCFWWLRGIKFGCRVSDSRLDGLKAKIYKLCLELLWRNSMKKFIISLRRQFFV